MFRLVKNLARGTKTSLRSKRFRLVSEQKETVEGDFRFWSREKLNENQKMKEGVFDSCSSFFAPKPHRNACYAGYKYTRRYFHCRRRCCSLPADVLWGSFVTHSFLSHTRSKASLIVLILRSGSGYVLQKSVNGMWLVNVKVGSV